MYQQHFGLRKRPFAASALGTDVFVGPQTAKAMMALNKALAVADAVVTVIGPAGVGKTTVVKRALAGMADSPVIVTVGRMQLEHDEVLELLLEELGARTIPAGTVQRFSQFRRMLKGLTDGHKQVFILVEDAGRIGIDALSELEALTAADAGVSDGANLVLMGSAEVEVLLKKPQLARLKQRIRLRQSIVPLGDRELLAYLKHCFRLAGREYDSLFAPGSLELIHQLTDGIPRIVNNLVESTMTTATDRKLSTLTPALIHEIAVDEYGLSADIPILTPASMPEVAATDPVRPPDLPGPDRQPAPAGTAVDAVAAVETPAIAPRAEHVVQTEADRASNPSTDPVESAQRGDDHEPIPKLIQDTLPRISILNTGFHEIPDFKGDPIADADGVEPEAVPSAAESAPQSAAEQSKRKPESSTRAPEPLIAGEEAAAPEAAAAVSPAEPKLAPVDTPPRQTAVPELGIEHMPLSDESSGSGDIPTLSSSMRIDEPIAEAPVASGETPEKVPALEAVDPAAESAEELAEWDRDPTLAELRPDLDALEEALAASYTEPEPPAPTPAVSTAPAAPTLPELDVEQSTQEKSMRNPAVAPSDETAAPVELPEITLDRQIKEKIAEATDLLRKTHPDIAAAIAAEDEAANSAAAEVPDSEEQKLDPKLQHVAMQLSKARTIDDVSDTMAETLWGEEISMIAAQVIANPPPEFCANDDLELVDDEPKAPAGQAPAATVESAPKAPARQAPAATVESAPKPAAKAKPLPSSAAERLATVQALNGGPPNLPASQESIVLGETNPKLKAIAAGNQPEPIEEQINLSITQTLKALNVSRMQADKEEETDSPKRGFFSRFRRS
jgi:general secretion pathway protein A